MSRYLRTTVRPLGRQLQPSIPLRSPFTLRTLTSSTSLRSDEPSTGSLGVTSSSNTQQPSKHDLYPVTQPPLDTYPAQASRNNANGTDKDVLERMKVREICEGWGLYRDAGEW